MKNIYMLLFILISYSALSLGPKVFQQNKLVLGGASENPTLSNNSGSYQVRLNATDQTLEESKDGGSTWSKFNSNEDLIASLSPVGNRIDFTPTGTWSNTTYSGVYWQEGQHAIVEYQLTLTGTPSGSLTLNPPSGLSIDTAAFPNFSANSASVMLDGFALESGVARYPIQDVLVTNSTTISPQVFNSSGSIAQTGMSNTAPFTFGSGDTVFVRVKIPIVGWTSGTDAVAKKRQLVKIRAIDIVGATSTTSFAFNYVNSVTELEDNLNALNDSGDIVFTAPHDGHYNIDFASRVNLSSAVGIECGLTIVSDLTSSKSNVINDANTTQYNKCYFEGLKLNEGDTVKFFSRKGGTASVSWDTDQRYSYLNITELPPTSVNIVTLDLPTYADDTAAGSGGLTTGQLYQTATGELRVKL